MKRIRGSTTKHEYLTDDYQSEEDIQLKSKGIRPKQEHTLEADVLEGDTLQAIALRFNCTIADIKRLNKIDKEFEIHARKTVKVPLNAFNLLETIPAVHKSGTNSPKLANQLQPTASTNNSIEKDPKLDEKLILASISNATYKTNTPYHDDEVNNDILADIEDPLLHSNPIPMRPPRNDFFSVDGSDCDLNWMCLLFVIIAICIMVPLIYLLYIYEHPDSHPQHSRYDDPDLKFLHHINNSPSTNSPK